MIVDACDTACTRAIEYMKAQILHIFARLCAVSNARPELKSIVG